MPPASCSCSKRRRALPLVNIRHEQPADIAAIDAVIVAAFSNAAHTDHTEQFIVRALRRAGALSVSLVAQDAGRIIGHAAASPVTISNGAPGWFGIGPVAVQPRHQGAGVGTRLMQAVLDELRAQGASGCVVLGEPAFYARFGFLADARLALAGVPAEYFQALPLQGGLPAGKVTYHPGFSARL